MNRQGTTEASAPRRTLINLKAVIQRTGLSKTTIYAWIAKGDFPRQVPLGSMARWVESEIDAWIDARVRARDASVA